MKKSISTILFIIVFALSFNVPAWSQTQKDIPKVRAENFITGITIAQANPPQSPTGVSASDGTFSNQVQVTWNIIPAATTYLIYRAELPSSKGGKSVQIAQTNETNFTDDSVNNGTRYYYWIKAKNTGGISKFSAFDTGYCGAYGSKPATPSNIEATDGLPSNKIIITGYEVPDATIYEIYRANIPVFFGGQIQSIGITSNTTFDDTTSETGNRYYYWVKSRNSWGVSNYSLFDTGYRGIALSSPSAPQSLSATEGTPLNITLSWNTVDDALVYEIWRANNPVSAGGKPKRINIISSTLQSYSDTLVSSGNTYYYWVKARNSWGSSSYSSYDSGYCRGALNSMTISPDDSSIFVGDTLQYSATGYFEDGSSSEITEQVTWRSSNKDIASFCDKSLDQNCEDGLVIGSNEGNVLITASIGDWGLTDNSNLSVIFDPNAPADIEVNAFPNTIISNNFDASDIDVTVIPIDTVSGEIVDGTQVDFKVISGNANLNSNTKYTVNAKVTNSLKSSRSGSISLQVKVNETDVAKLIDIDVVSKYSSMFETIPASSSVYINGYYQAGSSFGLTITNKSNRIFTLKKSELWNGNDFLGESTEKDLLSGGQLDAFESSGMQFTLLSLTKDEGITFKYYLIDQISYDSFIVEYDFKIKIY
ncbi:MAG: hypothetical protein HF978_01580 [Desulfobacteraceae bacterium]|nr:Ig-like domain-containing protein [Desulfobacteraceae bacterium]MBC2754216.1 hypothetical protein [Desulfobacteraceae bacterium]